MLSTLACTLTRVRLALFLALVVAAVAAVCPNYLTIIV